MACQTTSYARHKTEPDCLENMDANVGVSLWWILVSSLLMRRTHRLATLEHRSPLVVVSMMMGTWSLGIGGERGERDG